jgi:hypothetical protein
VFAAMVAPVAVTIGVVLDVNGILVIGGPRLTAAVRRRSARVS